MALRFEPACAPMILGSLPHPTAAQALAAARRASGELLAWPQLWQANLREQFLTQSAVGFPGLVIDEASQQVYVSSPLALEQLGPFALHYLENQYGCAKLHERDASGLYELLKLGAKPPGIRAIKGQNLGPISLALLLTDQQQRPLIYDPALFDALVQFVAMRVTWQEHVLGELGLPTLICLDEPFLEMIGSPFLPIDWHEAAAQLQLVFASTSGCRAISAGGAIDWGHVLRLDIDCVIGDVFGHGAGLLGSAETLASYIEGAGMVGFGLIPAEADTLAVTTAEQLVAHLSHLCDELARAGVDITKLLRQSIITTAGALGSLEVPQADYALDLLATTALLIRQRYAV